MRLVRLWNDEYSWTCGHIELRLLSFHPVLKVHIECRSVAIQIQPDTMVRLGLYLTFAAWAFGAAIAQAPCTPARRLAGVQQLVRTIETHRLEDAAKIPLDPRVTRVVTV